MHKFIALEGIDGAGTTTLMHNLERLLSERGERVHTTFEPTKGPTGQFIRTLLSASSTYPTDTTALALLFAADRKLHWLGEIEPALAQGKTVITDRYTLSSLAYQSLDVELSFLETINSSVPQAELVLYIDIEPEIGMERIARRGLPLERLESMELQTQIRKTYHSLLHTYSGAVITLDGCLPPEALAQAALRAILGESRGG